MKIEELQLFTDLTTSKNYFLAEKNLELEIEKQREALPEIKGKMIQSIQEYYTILNYKDNNKLINFYQNYVNYIKDLNTRMAKEALQSVNDSIQELKDSIAKSENNILEKKKLAEKSKGIFRKKLHQGCLDVIKFEENKIQKNTSSLAQLNKTCEIINMKLKQKNDSIVDIDSFFSNNEFLYDVFKNPIKFGLKKEDLIGDNMDVLDNYFNAFYFEDIVNSNLAYFKNEYKKYIVEHFCVLPEYYFEEDIIDKLIFLFANKRGRNVTEIINIYEQEKWQEKVIDKLNLLHTDNLNLSKQIAVGFENVYKKLDEINNHLENVNFQLKQNDLKFDSILNELEDANIINQSVLLKQCELVNELYLINNNISHINKNVKKISTRQFLDQLTIA